MKIPVFDHHNFGYHWRIPVGTIVETTTRPLTEMCVNHLPSDTNDDDRCRVAATRSWIDSWCGKIVCTVSLILTMTSVLRSDQSATSLNSGPDVGSDVSSFYVRAVTGPLAGKSVCYVCRNGDRPVVMVFLRDIGTDTTRLLKQLDQTVNQHRADGLRCFVVLLSDETKRDSARLQTLAFDEKLDLPLTLAAESLTGTISKSISPDAAITVILYDQLKVTARFAYRAGECNEADCQTMIDKASELAKNSAK